MTSTCNPAAVEVETRGSLPASIVIGEVQVPESMVQASEKPAPPHRTPSYQMTMSAPTLSRRNQLLCFDFFVVLFYFETGSCYVAQAGPKLLIFLKNYHT